MLRALLHRHLPRIWLQRRWPARLLLPLSLLYGALWRWQRQRARPQRVQAAVLVVGNVVAGGAGKTPATLAIVQHFLSRGLRVGIVSRGYARSRHAPPVMEVHPDTQAALCGDEPLLLRRRTGAPVVVGAQRVQAARELLRLHPHTQLIVCDDGLQHHALARDGEVCVMDARGIGNGYLLPAGPLREPWPRASDFLLYTEAPLRALHTAPQQALFVAQRRLGEHAVQASGQAQPLALWAQQGQAVLAAAGIAQPQRFFDMLAARGLRVSAHYALGDHASAADWAALLPELHASGLPVLCTEKDAVKLWALWPQAWAVPLHLELPEALLAALDGWWDALPPPPAPAPPQPLC